MSDMLPVTDTALLWAFAATEAASVAAAINALADQNEVGRRAAFDAQEHADDWSYRWMQEAGEIVLSDPTERLIACGAYLTEHLAELEELTERLGL